MREPAGRRRPARSRTTARARGTVALAGAALAAALCASGCSATTAGSSTPRSPRGPRSVWIADARSRTGTLATGERTEEQGERAIDVSEELRSAVRRVRGLELAPARDAADLVVYFEQADRLRCWRCPQPEDRWYWWGLICDAAGRELVILHGETATSSAAPARRFAAAVKAFAREARRGTRGT
jgi:hypothetical protein